MFTALFVGFLIVFVRVKALVYYSYVLIDFLYAHIIYIYMYIGRYMLMFLST